MLCYAMSLYETLPNEHRHLTADLQPQSTTGMFSILVINSEFIAYIYVVIFVLWP